MSIPAFRFDLRSNVLKIFLMLVLIISLILNFFDIVFSQKKKLQIFADFDTAQIQQKHFSNRETTVTEVLSELKLTKIG